MIEEWLNNEQIFEKGILLFEKFGNNEIWLNTFKAIGETDFTKAQLVKLLSALVEEKQPEQKQANKVLSSQNLISKSDLTDAPTSIKEVVERRKYLYATVNREHERLVAYVESQPEFKHKLSGEIKMRDVIKEMDKLDLRGQALPFNLIAITGNIHKNIGGEILHLQGVFQNKYRIKQERKVETNFERMPMQGTKSNNPLSNRVRHIFDPTTNAVRNVDMVLITHFNWKRMIY